MTISRRIFAIALVVATAALGRGRDHTCIGRRHDPDAGHGPEPAQRRQLTRWYIARRTGPPDLPRSTTTCTRSRRSSSTKGPRRRARRHGVRAVDARDGWLRLLRQRADPARVQQLRRASTRTTVGGRARRAPRRCSTCRSLSRCFPTPQIGVRANIQLLRSYADPRRRVCPTACACRPPIASGSRRSGSTSVAQLPDAASSSGRQRPTTASASSSSTPARSCSTACTRGVRAVLAGQQRAEVRQRLLDRDRATRGVYSFGNAALLRQPGEPAPEPAADQR